MNEQQTEKKNTGMEIKPGAEYDDGRNNIYKIIGLDAEVVQYRCNNSTVVTISRSGFNNMVAGTFGLYGIKLRRK